MNRHPRAAFTLVEMTIAAGLLAVVFGVLGQFMSRWEAARRGADERAFALRTLENALERAVAGDADLEALSSEATMKARLSSPQLQITAGEPDDLGLIPIRGTLSWQNAHGQRVAPVVLTAWKSASAAGTEESQ